MIDERDPTEASAEATNVPEASEAQAPEDGGISDAQLDDAAGGITLR